MRGLQRAPETRASLELLLEIISVACRWQHNMYQAWRNYAPAPHRALKSSRNRAHQPVGKPHQAGPLCEP